MLPKIHKTNNLGRPVVSSVNSHKEISGYIDNYDRWLNAYPPKSMTQLTSLIKPQLRALLRLPRNCPLATLDASSLKTNIDTNEGLTIVREELEKSGRKNPWEERISLLLEKVSELKVYVADFFIWNLELNDHEMESGIQYREPRLQDCLGLHYMKQTLLAAKWFFSPRQNHFHRKPRMDTVPALPANPHVFTKTAGHWIWF